MFTNNVHLALVTCTPCSLAMNIRQHIATSTLNACHLKVLIVPRANENFIKFVWNLFKNMAFHIFQAGDWLQKIWRVRLLSTFCDGKSRSRTTLCGVGGARGIFTEIIGWLFASHAALGLPCGHSNPSAIFSAAGTNSSMEFESLFTVSSGRKWLLVLTILLIPWYVRQMPNIQQLKDCISISFKEQILGMFHQWKMVLTEAAHSLWVLYHGFTILVLYHLHLRTGWHTPCEPPKGFTISLVLVRLYACAIVQSLGQIHNL